MARRELGGGRELRRDCAVLDERQPPTFTHNREISLTTYATSRNTAKHDMGFTNGRQNKKYVPKSNIGAGLAARTDGPRPCA